MRRVADQDDATALADPAGEAGDDVKRPDVDAGGVDVRGRGDGQGPEDVDVGLEEADERGGVGLDAGPVGAGQRGGNAALFADEEFAGGGGLRGEHEGAVGGGHDGQGLGDGGVGGGDGGGDAGEVGEAWCVRGVGVHVLADGGVDAVGADEEVGACCVAVGEGEVDAAGRCVFVGDLGEFAVPFDGDADGAHPVEEDGDQLGAVDAVGVVAVFGLGAEVIDIDEVAQAVGVGVAELEVGEVVALLADRGVDAQGVEDSQSVGRQHHGAADVEWGWTGFVDGDFACLSGAGMVEGEGKCKAGYASADDGNGRRRCRRHGPKCNLVSDSCRHRSFYWSVKDVCS